MFICSSVSAKILGPDQLRPMDLVEHPVKMEVKDKVFFITGGAKGLGRAYTQALLEKGAKVFFGDVNATAGAKTLDEMAGKFGADKVKFKPFDVTDKAAFEDAFNTAVKDFGQIDVHVNNAGIMNEGLWELMININISGLVYGTKLASAHMRKDKGGKGGRIINISSAAGFEDFPFVPIYSATKHAVRSFTSALAKQPNLAEQGIEFALLHPNGTATDLVTKLDETKIDFFDIYIGFINQTVMPPEMVVGAFMKLVQMKNMNGAMLMIGQEGAQFKKMETVDAPDPDAVVE